MPVIVRMGMVVRVGIVVRVQLARLSMPHLCAARVMHVMVQGVRAQFGSQINGQHESGKERLGENSHAKQAVNCT